MPEAMASSAAAGDRSDELAVEICVRSVGRSRWAGAVRSDSTGRVGMSK